MIRINLLAAERPTEKKRAAASAPGALQAYLLLAIFVGGALAASGLAYFFMSRSIADLDAKTAQAEKRQKELQVIKAQVEAFERKKALLDAKVKLIERLKSQQSGPVHMLDEISKALPEYVWLDSLEQAGGTLRIDGQANSLTSVADFILNLQRSGWFSRVESTDNSEDKGIVKFKLSADFRNATTTAEPAKPAQGVVAPATPPKS